MRYRRLLPLSLALASAACGQASGPKAQPTAKLAWTTLDVLAGQPGGSGWVDGTLVAAHFNAPLAITSDGKNLLFLSDGPTIRVVDRAAGTVTTIAGSHTHPGSADGVGLEATLNSPAGLYFSEGQIYIADTENHLLRKMDVQTGAVTTLAGAPLQPGAVDGQGTSARFQEPEGLALDAAGHLYIADTDNNTIRTFTLATGAVATVAGQAGMSGLTDGPANQASFAKPKGIAFDKLGNLYIIDTGNHSVRKLDPVAGVVSTVHTFSALPSGVVADGADMLISLSDVPVGNHSIARIAPDGTITELAGSTTGQGFVDGVGDMARFNLPGALLNDGAGTLYVVDSGNEALRSVALASNTVTTYAGASSLGSSDGAPSLARFSAPQGLAADDQFVYVADTGNDTIRRITLATGDVTTLAGVAGQPGQADGAFADARFSQPQGIALDVAAGRLYVADTLNHTVRQLDLAAGMVTTVTPPFGGPAGLAFDEGRLVVTDYANHVVSWIDLLKLAQPSILAGQQGVPGQADGMGTSAGFDGPIGIAGDGRGSLYVADSANETVRKIDIAKAVVTTVAGTPMIQGNHDGVRTAAQFSYPTGVVADQLGNVFVSDSQNNTVRRIDVSTGTVTTVVGAVADPGVRLGPLPAQLTQPSALALTPSGALLIVSENSVLIAH